MAEKTLPPTPKRLRDARLRGEVASSPDVSGTASFVVVLVAISLLGASLFGLLRGLWRQASDPAAFAQPLEALPALLLHAGGVLLWAAVPLLALAALAAASAAFAQVGALMAWQRVRPDVSRLNPAAGLKRVFSTRNLINLVKMVVKTGLLATMMFVVIRDFIGAAFTLVHASPAMLMSVGAKVVTTTFAWAALVYALMAAIDYVHQRHEFMREQRMSVQDVRQEHNESQGNPINMSRRRSAHFEAVYFSLKDRVAAASAVIHSPRLAIALQYRGADDLPRVIARGEGELAAQIRRAAAEAMIPTEFDPDLAARLYDDVPLDQPIPRALYEPVARLLRWAQGGQ